MWFYLGFRSFFILTGIFLILQSLGQPTLAQTLEDFDSKEVLATFEGKLDPAPARAGEEVRIVISANIEEKMIRSRFFNVKEYF